MENSIFTTITTIDGYEEIQLWTNGNLTYTDASGNTVPLSEKRAVLEVLNKMRNPKFEPFKTIQDVEEYIKITGENSFMIPLSNLNETDEDFK